LSTSSIVANEEDEEYEREELADQLDEVPRKEAKHSRNHSSSLESSIVSELENTIRAYTPLDADAEELRGYLERALDHANEINRIIEPDWTGWRIKSIRMNPVSNSVAFDIEKCG